jgi:hypothetical protein
MPALCATALTVLLGVNSDFIMLRCNPNERPIEASVRRASAPLSTIAIGDQCAIAMNSSFFLTNTGGDTLNLLDVLSTPEVRRSPR